MAFFPSCLTKQRRITHHGSLHGWRDIRACDDEDGKPHETKEAGVKAGE